MAAVEKSLGVWPSSFVTGLPLKSFYCSILCGQGLIATVPATPSTLEDYAGRSRGNGIEPPIRERTVTVPVFVWICTRADAGQLIKASVRLRPENGFAALAW